jgi:hypothetical protein
MALHALAPPADATGVLLASLRARVGTAALGDLGSAPHLSLGLPHLTVSELEPAPALGDPAAATVWNYFLAREETVALATVLHRDAVWTFGGLSKGPVARHALQAAREAEAIYGDALEEYTPMILSHGDAAVLAFALASPRAELVWRVLTPGGEQPADAGGFSLGLETFHALISRRAASRGAAHADILATPVSI